MTMGADDYVEKPLSPETLQGLARTVAAGQGLVTEREPAGPILSLRRQKWEYLNKILYLNGGNITRAARALGVRRQTLQQLLRKPRDE